MVEVLGMVRLNKSMAEYDTTKVAKLPNDTWERMIPKRPDLPEGYFQDEPVGEDGSEASSAATTATT
jgi:hypothetical protein